MATDFTPDPRILDYEKLARIKDGKAGGLVSIDEGTRIYREIGNARSLRLWLREVQKVFDGELVPFEWVADYVGISRVALHKRVNKGKLTVLVYEMRENVRGILGGTRERMRQEYKFIPRKECDEWRNILLDEQE